MYQECNVLGNNIIIMQYQYHDEVIINLTLSDI